jgi:hypothetical protein
MLGSRWKSVAWLPAVLAACGGAAAAQDTLGGTQCTDLRGLPINRDVDWQTQVKPILDDTRGGACSGCHAGVAPDYLDLTDNGIDAIYKLVPGFAVPGRPLASELFDRVNCEDPGSGPYRMPLMQVPLSVEQQALIYDWIAQGALGDVEGEPEIPRDFLFRDGAESLRWY